MERSHRRTWRMKRKMSRKRSCRRCPPPLPEVPWTTTTSTRTGGRSRLATLGNILEFRDSILRLCTSEKLPMPRPRWRAPYPSALPRSLSASRCFDSKSR